MIYRGGRSDLPPLILLMVQRLIKNLKLADGLLILFLLALVFLEAFSWVQTGFPREIRESVQLAAADDFSKGINIYSLEAIRGEEFPTLNLYGCLSPLLIGGLSRLTGVSVLLMGTICYVFWKLGACFLMGYIVLRKHKDITLALLCAALLYPCFWRYEVFGGIFPDALGLFLSMLFYCVTEMGILKKRLHPFWMAFIMLLLFYTKLYFTFLLVGAALWLFLYSKTDFFHYILFGLTIGIASVGFVFWALPLFFSCSSSLPFSVSA